MNDSHEKQAKESECLSNEGGSSTRLVSGSHVVYSKDAGLRFAHIEVVEHLWSIDVACFMF